MAPSMSSTRELAIAGSKRPASSTLSDVDHLSDLSESPSDFEETSKPIKKSAKKKPRTTKGPSPPSEGEVFAKISKDYQTEEGYQPFTDKWWREILKRDETWIAIRKNMSKTAMAKRLHIVIATDLNEEAGKESHSTGLARVTAGKTRKITAARKSTQKAPQSTSSADALADLNTAGDATSASIEVAEEKKTQVKPRDDAKVSEVVDLSETATQPVQEPATTDSAVSELGGDLISNALADPNITPEKREEYLAIQKDQEDRMRAIEEEVRAKKCQEEAREKRAAAKERKAAEEAKTKVGESDELALENGGSDKKEKQRKVFAPTKF